MAKKAELQEGTVNFTALFFLLQATIRWIRAAVDRQKWRSQAWSRSERCGPGLGIFDERRDGGTKSGMTSRDLRMPLDPLEARGGKVTPELSSVVIPDASGNVKFYAVAYPPAPVDSTVVMKIEIWQDEKLVMRSPVYEVPIDSNGSASMLASVPAAKLQTGHFEAQVSFQYQRRTVDKKVGFQVVTGS